MKTCCQQYLTVLKRASSLGFKTSRKLVLLALKIRLQNDGSVNAFKSSYTSSGLVFNMSLSDICEDVTNNLLTVIPTFWRPYCSSVEDDLNTSLERGIKLGLARHPEYWSWGSWKYVFRTTGRLTFLSLHTRIEDQSWRLVFKTSLRYILPAG